MYFESDTPAEIEYHLIDTDGERARCDLPQPLGRDAEDLLSRLIVKVKAFSFDEIGRGSALRFQLVDEIVVHYVLEGEGSIHWSGGGLELRKGMIAVVPANLEKVVRGAGQPGAKIDAAAEWLTFAHWNGCAAPCRSSDALIIISATISASAGHGLGFFENLDGLLVECALDTALGAVFDGILEELALPGIGSKGIVEALFKQVLLVLLRRAMPRLGATPLIMTIADTRLAQVVKTINISSGERLSIPSLSKLAGMTPFGLTREFERVFGESLLDYILGVRLEQASNLLTHTDLPIKSIAASVGFASRSHFSRTFARRKGEDPTAFRKSNAIVQQADRQSARV